VRYLVRLYRLGDGDRREQDSVMLTEVEGDASKEFADDIAERASEKITEAIVLDVRTQLTDGRLGAIES
jgi:hypothetical protein